MRCNFFIDGVYVLCFVLCAVCVRMCHGWDKIVGV